MQNNDFKHISCNVVLICGDALTPDQLQRKREGKNGLVPLNEESIEEILNSWREKLKREIPNSIGYFVFGHDA